MTVAMKWDEVSHDLISILSKSKWIKFSMAVCFIFLNKKGDPQGKGSPYQEVRKNSLIANASYQIYFITKNNKLKFFYEWTTFCVTSRGLTQQNKGFMSRYHDNQTGELKSIKT